MHGYTHECAHPLGACGDWGQRWLTSSPLFFETLPLTGPVAHQINKFAYH